MYLINVDRPLQRCIIHQQHCEHTHSRKNKPLNKMGPDGGWFEMASYIEASKFFQDHVRQYGIDRMKECDDCH